MRRSPRWLRFVRSQLNRVRAQARVCTCEPRAHAKICVHHHCTREVEVESPPPRDAEVRASTTIGSSRRVEPSELQRLHGRIDSWQRLRQPRPCSDLGSDSGEEAGELWAWIIGAKVPRLTRQMDEIERREGEAGEGVAQCAGIVFRWLGPDREHKGGETRDSVA